jgi:hypothetical protein
MMMNFVSSGWEIAISAMLPFATAIIFLIAEVKGPLAKWFRTWTGSRTLDLASLSILFGLFAALLVNDVWQKANAAGTAVHEEGAAVRSLAHSARAAGIEASIIPKLKAYIASASAEDPYARESTSGRGGAGGAYDDLLAAITRTPGVDSGVRQTMLSSARDLLRAHDNRLYLANDATAPIKWFAILLFGTITQLGLLLTHVEDRRTMRINVALFTVAFAFCLIIVSIFDAPFDIAVAGEPGNTLKLALEGL